MGRLTTHVLKSVQGRPAGSYFASSGLALSDLPFLDEVVVCFSIAKAGEHYHVPLLLSPWSHSTDRGS